MGTIWFIRHTQSESNAGLPITSQASVKLTARGIEQAPCIAQAFSEAPSLIVTSRYVRTQLTAQPTIERFPTVGQEVWPAHEFTFLSSRHYRDTTVFERESALNTCWERWDPFYVEGEGAESFANLMDRVEQVIELCKACDGHLTAVFSHGDFLRSLTWRLLVGRLEINPRNMQRCRSFIKSFLFPNGGILKVQFQPNGEVRFSNVITSHLPPHLGG